MTAPLVIRLLSQIQERRDPEARAMLLAELACYYARIGEFEDAETMRRDLRAEFSDGHSAPVSILIMVLESLLLYFRELSPLARDRMLRANLLSKAFREKRLVLLTSAWLAHIDFNQGRFDSMATAIQSTLETIESDDGTANCRVSLVLGDAFSFCGQPVVSRYWYERARQIAVTLGDQAAVGALTYNRAALHVANLRLLSLSSPVEEREIALARGELQSAINYQFVANLKSLNHLLKSSSIGVAILEHRYCDALKMLNVQFLKEEVPSASQENALHLADLAMCLAHSGQEECSRRRVDEVIAMPLDNLDSDERALVFESLSSATAAMTINDKAAEYHAQSRSALEEHLLIVGVIGELIARYRNVDSSN